MEVGSSTLPGTTLRRNEVKPMCTQAQRALSTTFGGLAQLARAPALQAGGQRFESVILHPSSITEEAIFDILGKRKARLANRSKDDFTRTAESIRNDD